MTVRFSCSRVLLLALLAAPLPAAAQDSPAASPTTRLIPYTAVLPGGGPDAAASVRAVTFALFDEAEGGTLLWSEIQTVSVDGRGRYSAHLGASTALPLDIFRTERARWLEVSIDGRALPRTMLVAVPYALRAADAETLGGRPLSEFVRTDEEGRTIRGDGTIVDPPAVDGSGVPNQLAKWNGATTLSSSIITESFDNRIGVLAPDPTGGGAVDSVFTIRNPDNNTGFGILNPSNQRRFALNTNANGSWTLFDGGSSTWNTGLRQLNGNVGLGIAPSTPRLLVDEDTAGTHAMRVTSAANSITVVAVSGATSTFSGKAAVVGSTSDSGIGVFGWGFGAATGIFGFSETGFAGNFTGAVNVTGTLTKSGGSFQIDHPLDPANKYLRHSFVESPDMMNVYNGNATLDANGDAWVTLPDWFEVLNRDFRYQLTSIGGPATPYVASKVAKNRFKIGGGIPGGEVSWQVTGIRQDAWANAHRIVVEEDKPGKDRGFFLHPDAFGQPADLAVPALRGGVVSKKQQ